MTFDVTLMPLVLAHLSDLHLGPVEGFALRHWNVKRGLGYANWVGRRRRVHQPHVVARLLEDLATQQVDHIVVTGDLINIGLPREYENALRWLEALGPPDRVTVVPGNHDIYVRLKNDPGIGRWRPYFSERPQRADAAAGAEFPFVRRLGSVALIGLCSAVPTPPFVAAGRVGRPRDRAGNHYFSLHARPPAVTALLADASAAWPAAHPSTGLSNRPWKAGAARLATLFPLR